MYVYDLSPHKLPNFETLPILRMLNSVILLRFEFPSSFSVKFRDVNISWFSVSRVCCIKFRVLVSRLFFLVVICFSMWNILRLMLKEKISYEIYVDITKQSWSFFYCCTMHFDNIKIPFTNKCTVLLNT
jgi:hypothetical protein